MKISKETLAAEKLISYYRLSGKELNAESILDDYRRISEDILAEEPEIDKVTKEHLT